MSASSPSPDTAQREKIAVSDTPPQPLGDKEPHEGIVPEVATEDDGGSTDGLERWNSPRINTYRFLATNLAMLIMGMNDACLGVSLIVRVYHETSLSTN